MILLADPSTAIARWKTSFILFMHAFLRGPWPGLPYGLFERVECHVCGGRTEAGAVSGFVYTIK